MILYLKRIINALTVRFKGLSAVLGTFHFHRLLILDGYKPETCIQIVKLIIAFANSPECKLNTSTLKVFSIRSPF